MSRIRTRDKDLVGTLVYVFSPQRVVGSVGNVVKGVGKQARSNGLRYEPQTKNLQKDNLSPLVLSNVGQNG